MWPLFSIGLCLVVVLGTVNCRSSQSCAEHQYRSGSGQCLQCTECPAGQQASPCLSFQDAVCIPPPPETPQQAHDRRRFEERARASVQHSQEMLHVEMSRLENLVYEWQISVFVISILVTCALVFSCFSMLACRARAVVNKGLEDYSHLVDRNAQRAMESLDQGNLAYADFDRTKIGPCADDSPYGQLSSTVRPKASARVTTNYKRLVQSPV